MAKNYRIKRSKNMGGGSSKARPHPFTVIISVIVFAGLLYLGASAFPPVYDFITRMAEKTPREETSASEPEVSASEAEEVKDTSEPEPETEPAAQPPEAAEAINAAYLPFDAASDIAAAQRFIDGLSVDVNAVMIEVKNSQGQILYDTKNENAVTWGAVSDKLIDLPGIVKLLNERDMRLVVRMHAFSDPIAARGDRVANAIKYQGGEMLWLDNYADRGGKPWLNPYEPEVRQYLIDIAKETVELGAVMVVMDSVRFPDDMTGSATFGDAAQGISREQALSTFMREAGEALEPLGARTAVYLPATAIGLPQRDSRYGGNPLAIAENVVLGILPELLETGYLAEGVTVSRPAADISRMIQEVLSYARSQPVVRKPDIIPLIGGSPTGVVPMTMEMVGMQVAACENSGSQEYIIYSSSGIYPSKYAAG